MTKSGRSETGRLRNFAAMSPAKLYTTTRWVIVEGNDPEALDKLANQYDGISAIALRKLAREVAR